MTKHEGAMIAITAPKDVIKQLKKSDIKPQEEFHLTLLYLGKAKDLKKNAVESIKKALTKICAKHQPLNMCITGSGAFTPGDKGFPIFVIPNAKGLNALQSEIEDSISNIIDLDSEYGWAPHMTIEYAEKPEIPILEKPITWKADKISLYIGGEKVQDFPLFKISKRAMTDQEYEELLEKEYKEMEKREQEIWNSMTEEEKQQEEEYWENYSKEMEKREEERRNKPKRKYSQLTADELEMLAEMYPEERQEWLDRNVEADAKFNLSKRAAFSIIWTKPAFENEKGELLRVAEEEGISYDSLKRSFHHGFLKPLDRKVWEHLENTDSLQVKTLPEAFQLAENYGREPMRLVDQFYQNRRVEAPIVLERNDGSITLVAGNTRLAFARAYHVKPEVYWIKETELFNSPYSVD